MDTNVRKGGRTTLPPLYSAAISASMIQKGEMKSD